MSVTLEKIHEDLLSIKKELNRIASYFEEDRLELSEEVKSGIEKSRRRSASELISQAEVEKEFS